MSYLLTQMFLYMIVALLAGLLLGWLIWRYGKMSQTDYDALRTERDKLAKERQDLNTNLDACRARSAQERERLEALRGENLTLQSRIEAMEVERAAVPDPVPVAAVVSAPAFTGVASRPEALSGPRGGVADDLKLISGVGPKMERLCNSLGFYHFDQIASWTPSEVAWVDDNLEGFKGRVSRDNWIDQARKLARA